MLNYTSLALALAGTSAIIIISYLIGLLLQKSANAVNKNTTTLDSFWLLFCGFFFLLSMYAIIVTKGATMLLLVPLLIFLFNWKKVATPSLYRGESISINRKKDFQFLIACVLFHFVLFSLVLYSFHPDTVKYIKGDFNIYLRVAEYLNKFGIENNSLDPIYYSEYAAVPYHYGDIWLYALASKFIAANPSVVVLISFTTLSTLAVYGIKTYLYEKFGSYLTNKYFYLYLIVFCCLFSGFAIFFPTFLLHADAYALSILNFPKALLPLVIFIGLLILASSKDWTALIIITIIGGLSFINILPQVYMAVTLLMLFYLVKRGITVKKAIGLGVFLILVTAGSYWLLYKVISVNHVMLPIGGPLELHTTFKLGAYIKTCINIFGSGAFQLFTITPYLIILIVGLFIIYRKNVWQQIKSVSPDIVLIALLFFCGLACWSILHTVTSEAVQFFSNGLIAIYAIIIPLILIWVITVVQNKTLTVITFLLVVASVVVNIKNNILTGEFDKNEWNKMTTFFKADDTVPGFVSLRSDAYFSAFFTKNTNGYIPLDVLTYMWPSYYNLSLNAPYIKADSASAYYKIEKDVIEAAPFTKYARKNALQKNNKEYLVSSFLKKFHIKYITVAKDTILPIHLRQAVQDSLILKSSGWKIYRLSVL